MDEHVNYSTMMFAHREQMAELVNFETMRMQIKTITNLDVVWWCNSAEKHSERTLTMSVGKTSITTSIYVSPNLLLNCLAQIVREGGY